MKLTEVLNLYDLHSDPKTLDKHDQMTKQVHAIIWGISGWNDLAGAFFGASDEEFGPTLQSGTPIQILEYARDYGSDQFRAERHVLHYHCRVLTTEIGIKEFVMMLEQSFKDWQQEMKDAHMLKSYDELPKQELKVERLKWMPNPDEHEEVF